MNEKFALYLKHCPFCGGPAELYIDFKEMPDTTQRHDILCKDTFGCGARVTDMISGYAPDYKDQIQALADRWNRRPDISEEEVKEHCRARNYIIVAAELFMRLARGITYRADEMPIDGTAAYRIGGDSKTLWLTVPNGSIKGDKIGNRVIVQEESTPFVKTYYTEDIAP